MPKLQKPETYLVTDAGVGVLTELEAARYVRLSVWTLRRKHRDPERYGKTAQEAAVFSEPGSAIARPRWMLGWRRGSWRHERRQRWYRPRPRRRSAFVVATRKPANLSREARKLDRDRILAPWLLVASSMERAGAALFAAASGFTKLLRHELSPRLISGISSPAPRRNCCFRRQGRP